MLLSLTTENNVWPACTSCPNWMFFFDTSPLAGALIVAYDNCKRYNVGDIILDEDRNRIHRQKCKLVSLIRQNQLKINGG